MSALPRKRTWRKGEPRPELNEHCRNGHGKEFYFVPTHSLMKRARSFISIFCCSARLVHSRIFCAFSCDIIFSGAVAFIGPGNCADAACANIATPKDSAKSNAIGRCRCIYVTQRPVLTKIIAKEPRVQRGCVMPTMSALGPKQTYALHKGMSALPPIATAKADSRKRSCLLYRGHQWETSAIALATASAKSANFRDRAPCMKSSRRPLVISSWTPAPRRPLLQILLLL